MYSHSDLDAVVEQRHDSEYQAHRYVLRHHYAVTVLLNLGVGTVHQAECHRRDYKHGPAVAHPRTYALRQIAAESVLLACGLQWDHDHRYYHEPHELRGVEAEFVILGGDHNTYAHEQDIQHAPYGKARQRVTPAHARGAVYDLRPRASLYLPHQKYHRKEEYHKDEHHARQIEVAVHASRGDVALGDCGCNARVAALHSLREDQRHKRYRPDDVGNQITESEHKQIPVPAVAFGGDVFEMVHKFQCVCFICL